jgi:hypothetical protein
MEFRTLLGLPDGGASALRGGEDIVSHQTKTDQENGLLGSRKMFNACTGHRADALAQLSRVQGVET